MKYLIDKVQELTAQKPPAEEQKPTEFQALTTAIFSKG